MLVEGDDLAVRLSVSSIILQVFTVVNFRYRCATTKYSAPQEAWKNDGYGQWLHVLSNEQLEGEMARLNSAQEAVLPGVHYLAACDP